MSAAYQTYYSLRLVTVTPQPPEFLALFNNRNQETSSTLASFPAKQLDFHMCKLNGKFPLIPRKWSHSAEVNQQHKDNHQQRSHGEMRVICSQENKMLESSSWWSTLTCLPWTLWRSMLLSPGSPDGTQGKYDSKSESTPAPSRTIYIVTVFPLPSKYSRYLI